MNVVMAGNRMALGLGLVCRTVKKMIQMPSMTIQSHRNLYDKQISSVSDADALGRCLLRSPGLSGISV
jgi:hypothetical protein